MNTVGIVGVGLVGGSLALALKRAGNVEIIGCDPAIPENRLSSLVDRHCDSVAELADGCDVIVIAAPVGAALSLLAELAPVCSERIVVTDVGSTKRNFIAAAREAFGAQGRALPASLVPGHPVAGSEKSGAAAAREDLFQGRRVVLTPLEETDPATHMWEQVGAEVTRMDAEMHDALFAATSHLPHMAAYALINALLASPHRERAIGYAAGGLRDFTRIAGSDPVMWRDICLANRDNLVAAIAALETELKRLRELMSGEDATALVELFDRAAEYCHRLNRDDGK